MAEFTKTISDRAFKAISSGKKRIEIRANKNELTPNSVNSMKEGDVVTFVNQISDETISCVIDYVNLYQSVRELLTNEGTQYSLSSTNDLEDGIKSIESIPNYKEYIDSYGVFAIKLSLLN